MSTAPGALRLADSESRQDLATYVARAKRLDPDGAARLSCHASVLAVYVSPLHGGGLPDIVGLRTFSLAEPSDVDLIVDLAALTDRLARAAADPVLPLPPVPATGVSWAGVSPPRSGWTALGRLPSDVLVRAARAGIADVATGVPAAAGGHVVTRVRAAVWSRPVDVPPSSALFAVALPAGAAFTADGLGFVDGGDVPVFAAGPWHRLSTRRGHVLVRRRLLA